MYSDDYYVIQNDCDDKFVIVVKKENKYFLSKSVHGIVNLIDILEELPEKSCIRLYKLSYKKN